MMTLGELYEPKGLALETARVVLECEKVFGCNVAWGCSNDCTYCFGRRGRYRKGVEKVRLPKEDPVKLVSRQLTSFGSSKRQSFGGVFLSFFTDPFLPVVEEATRGLVRLLLKEDFIVATLSKLDVSWINGARHGMTVVSLDDAFWRQFEPAAARPRARIERLIACKAEGNFVWVSMEPYPVSAIYRQKLSSLLEELTFVNLVIFGRWNYDGRALTEESRIEYAEKVNELLDWGKSSKVRVHVKSQTLKWVNPIEVEKFPQRRIFNDSG